jgi:hypothetical protein
VTTARRCVIETASALQLLADGSDEDSTGASSVAATSLLHQKGVSLRPCGTFSNESRA